MYFTKGKDDIEKEKRYLQYEKILENYKGHLNAISVCIKKHQGEITDAWKLYFYVFAPVMADFAEWIVEKAMHEKKKRLYFLSRDGYPMYLATQKICRSRNIGIECRYLKVSRYALRMAEYHLMGKNCVEYLCVGGIDVTFEKLMKRGGLTDKEAKEIAEKCDYIDKYRQILPYREIMELRNTLAEMPEFITYVCEHSQKAYPTAMGYLIQEGLLTKESYAIVDSGWVGTIQKSIERLLRTENGKIQLTGYYFGLYEIPKNAKPECYQTYYFGPEGRIRRKVYFNNCLFETVYSSPDGMTISYCKEKKAYVPVEDTKGALNKEELYSENLLLVEYMDAYLSGSYRNKEGQKLAQKLFALLMGKPKFFETRALGTRNFSDDVHESGAKEVAAFLPKEELGIRAILQKLAGTEVPHESAWREGSIIQNGVHIKIRLFETRIYKYMTYIRKAIRNHG